MAVGVIQSQFRASVVVGEKADCSVAFVHFENDPRFAHKLSRGQRFVPKTASDQIGTWKTDLFQGPHEHPRGGRLSMTSDHGKGFSAGRELGQKFSTTVNGYAFLDPGGS